MFQNKNRKRALTPIENVPTGKKRRALVSTKPVKKANTGDGVKKANNGGGVKKANNGGGSGDSSSKIKVMLRCRASTNTKNISSIEPVKSDPKTKVLLKTNNTIYTYDRVFDQHTKQQTVYEEIAEPVLKEVLKGYNCTIFAYGQTGTGKTFTMEGDLVEEKGGYGENAGIIPRTIRQLFHELKSMDPENHVMVSMLELYNEELRDLLCFSDDPRQLNIFEDGTGVVVQGLKEHAITSVDRGIEVMKSGVKKRITAATNMNDKSSRSHSIFTITVYLRETSSKGEKSFRVGKLNLVDLAGSENSRSSGSEQLRAREAANINRSLLTLGRVINSLVDTSTHIPYRESKLTRLLKDSLGGHTKTYIIATVSPEQQTFEEIKSTLDYASHANGICNRPQANIPISSDKHVGTLISNLEQMDYNLQMNYDKNGVYQPKKVYDATKLELQTTKETLLGKESEILNLKTTLQQLQNSLELEKKKRKEMQVEQDRMLQEMKIVYEDRLQNIRIETGKEIELWKKKHGDLKRGISNFKNDTINNWQIFSSKYM